MPGSYCCHGQTVSIYCKNAGSLRISPDSEKLSIQQNVKQSTISAKISTHIFIAIYENAATSMCGKVLGGTMFWLSDHLGTERGSCAVY